MGEKGEAMNRDLLAEAIAIVEGRTMLLARKEHLEVVLGTLQAVMNSADYDAMKYAHQYPVPELADVKFVGAEGQA